MNDSSIKRIYAHEILDSRGNPTLLARVVLTNDIIGEASVPSGASTGTHEAYELRDGDERRYNGKGVLRAMKLVDYPIAPKLYGLDVCDQRLIDDTMIKLDGTPQKKELGANTILALSLACARAAAQLSDKPLYEYLRKAFWPNKLDWIMPIPQMNVLNGGKHAPGSVDMQEFMIIPIRASSFADALRMGAEVYHALKSLLQEKGVPVGVGDEGGFMPRLSSHREVLSMLITAIEKAGYQPGTDFVLALDPAASEFYRQNAYALSIEKKSLSSDELIDYYAAWVDEFPIKSIEDGLAEDDWDGFKNLTQRIGDQVQTVGDDLFVTNVERLQKGIDQKAANAILVKPNQIGTLTETVDVITKAQQAGFATIISHRSGETEDTFIADLAVACNAGQIKTGAPCRSERVAKYNRLLMIEQELSGMSYYSPFK